MIVLTGVSRTYVLPDREVPALLPLDLAVGDGEFVSIVGHSGSGKSTLLSIAGGLARPDSGSVLMDGEDLWGLDDRARSRLRNRCFGFVFQFASLVPTLTSVENVLLPSAFGAARTRGEALALIEAVGLSGKEDRYPSELSGGEQQRTAIARAFIGRPKVVLADEPTGNLDESTETDIIRFFERMNREQGTAIVLVTHSAEIAARAGRRFRMAGGALTPLH